jgi:phosphoglycerate dehydrogenase-like enzyme
LRLLIHSNVYERNRDTLDAQKSEVELLLMGEDGRLRLNGTEVPIEEAQPEIVFANADVFFTPVAQPFMFATLKSRALKWVQSGSAGLDNPVFRQIVQSGARLTASHGQAVGMADYVLWAVLDVLQDGPGRRSSQAAGTWQRRQSREVHGTRWLVVGFGAVGQGIGLRAGAFGAHVTGVRRDQAPDVNADAIIALSDLKRFLPDSDVVVLAVPTTDQTLRLADSAFFDAMKPDSVFVNVGRGALVDEPSLLAALDKGVLASAVLDVFDTEPLPPDSPFWTHPRVMVTAHCSGLSRGNPKRNDAAFFDNLHRYLAGEALLNEAKPEEILTEGVKN